MKPYQFFWIGVAFIALLFAYMWLTYPASEHAAIRDSIISGMVINSICYWWASDWWQWAMRRVVRAVMGGR